MAFMIGIVSPIELHLRNARVVNVKLEMRNMLCVDSEWHRISHLKFRICLVAGTRVFKKTRWFCRSFCRKCVTNFRRNHGTGEL